MQFSVETSCAWILLEDPINGSLKDESVGFDSGKVKVFVEEIGVEYNLSNAGVKFCFSV